MYKPYYDKDASTLVFIDGNDIRENYFYGRINVFVCGSLQNPEKMSSILGESVPFATAAVSGYKRSTEIIDGKEIPFMIPSTDEPWVILTGIVWLDLSDELLNRIESIELDGNYRHAVSIDVQAGERKLRAVTYIKK